MKNVKISAFLEPLRREKHSINYLTFANAFIYFAMASEVKSISYLQQEIAIWVGPSVRLIAVCREIGSIATFVTHS
jgi:hypothetical protein